MKHLILFLMLISLTTGCANMKKSLLVGTSIGLATGAALGNAQASGDERNKSTQNGAMIGALLGAGISYLAHKDKLKKLERERLISEKTKKDVPLLTRPKVKRLWVEDKVQGRRFIKGHWEFVIEEQSVWNQ